MKTASQDPAKTRLPALSALFTALLASICCILPLVVGLLGVGAGLVGSLAVFEMFRPVFILLTVGLLGFAFYRMYRPAARCGPDGSCDLVDPALRRRSLALLWSIAVFALAALLFPYYIPFLLG